MANSYQSEKSSPPTSSVDRRDFLRLAATGTAALVGSAKALKAEEAAPKADTPAEAKEADVLTADRTGSDFMVDVLKTLNFEYVFSNPGSSFRGLQESFINYGSNKNPEWLTCCHEESSVAMAHGYAKIEGKPGLVFAHGTVGLQHAAMAIYNAFCDRVPVYLILGNTMDATMRRPGVEWYHSVQDAALMVRDYIKWDDLPISLAHFAESAARAYKIAMTPPMEPVVLVADSELQERAIDPGEKLRIPKLSLTTPPQGDSGAVSEAARLLVSAENPVIIADRCARTQAGMKYLVELAERLQASVIDQGGRMNFPSRHALNQSDRRAAVLGSADVVLALEVADFWGATHSVRDQLTRSSRSLVKSGAKLISISAMELYIKSNYQDFQRFPETDLPISGDAEATLPTLIEEVKRLTTADRKRAFQDRGSKLAAAQHQSVERARAEAAWGWDASPISLARLCAELWAQIKDKDWSLVAGNGSGWPARLWNFDKYHQHIGGSGAAGVGYGSPAAVGAALANKKHGRFSVNIQNDGDLMYAPGVLWTAAHHRIPLLNVMHNNRAYHQEVMHIQRMANRHSRGVDTAHIGSTIDDPNIDYAKLAQSMGWYAEGPITDPKDLGPALKRAVAVAAKGEPALIDVVTQPR
ncbi:MAG: twin-arginine translocation signal domain-containing protein [Acidobacteria bacterium]|nr:twin-arginine translocation signal domain-containing protein [Acidobacteriota bacterium]